MKLTASMTREIAKTQPGLAADIEAFKKLRRTRAVTLTVRSAGETMYLAEGARLTWYTPDGRTLNANMVSEFNLGKVDSSGMDYKVGQYTPPMPEGTWCFETEIFLGKWYGTLHYFGALQLS